MQLVSIKKIYKTININIHPPNINDSTTKLIIIVQCKINEYVN